MGEIALAAAERARRAFPHRDIELKVAPNLPLVRGDPGLLEQVLFNLLDNADKFTPGGTPTRARLSRSDGEIEIVVEDEGPGIPAEARGRIFEKFTRLSGADGRPAGTGLGLAIAKGVIEAIGGTIGVESPTQTGTGTAIVIRIPVAEEDKIVADTDPSET